MSVEDRLVVTAKMTRGRPAGQQIFQHHQRSTHAIDLGRNESILKGDRGYSRADGVDKHMKAAFLMDRLSSQISSLTQQNIGGLPS